MSTNNDTPDVVDMIMRFEGGLMEDEQEVIDLFQYLVDTGMAWSLQGSYGRAARSLIDAGYVTSPDFGEDD